MTVHLVKIAVGIESLEHLREIQAQRIGAGNGKLRHMTRNRPRREDEVLDGGCIYWIIKGYIRARQRIICFEDAVGRNGRKRCALVLDPELERTALMPHRPIQGWRYMEAEAAPAVAEEWDTEAEETLPEGMAEELRALGLL